MASLVSSDNYFISSEKHDMKIITKKDQKKNAQNSDNKDLHHKTPLHSIMQWRYFDVCSLVMIIES